MQCAASKSLLQFLIEGHFHAQFAVLTICINRFHFGGGFHSNEAAYCEGSDLEEQNKNPGLLFGR